MRTIGSRTLPPLSATPTAAALAAAAHHTATLVALAGDTGLTGVRKGVYRFASHAEHNRTDVAAVASHIAMLAHSRQKE